MNPFSKKNSKKISINDLGKLQSNKKYVSPSTRLIENRFDQIIPVRTPRLKKSTIELPDLVNISRDFPDLVKSTHVLQNKLNYNNIINADIENNTDDITELIYTDNLIKLDYNEIIKIYNDAGIYRLIIWYRYLDMKIFILESLKLTNINIFDNFRTYYEQLIILSKQVKHCLDIDNQLHYIYNILQTEQTINYNKLREHNLTQEINDLLNTIESNDKQPDQYIDIILSMIENNIKQNDPLIKCKYHVILKNPTKRDPSKITLVGVCHYYYHHISDTDYNETKRIYTDDDTLTCMNFDRLNDIFNNRESIESDGFIHIGPIQLYCDTPVVPCNDRYKITVYNLPIKTHILSSISGKRRVGLNTIFNTSHIPYDIWINKKTKNLFHDQYNDLIMYSVTNNYLIDMLFDKLSDIDISLQINSNMRDSFKKLCFFNSIT